MDQDMRKSLLNKKSATFDKQYQDCLVKVQRIKQKNDFMQKQVGTDVEEGVKQQVSKQKQFIQKEIKELKKIMNDLDNKFKDPESKNKIKNLKIDAQKQIQRNKIILKDFINKSFVMKSRSSVHSDQDVNQYVQGGAVNYNYIGNQSSKDKPLTKNRRQDDEQQQEDHYQGQSLITDNNLDIDFEIERKILQEKKQLLDEVEQTTLRVNDIMNDMAIMVDQQGQNLEIISEEMLKANKNLIEANKDLDQANTLQKKSRRKYVCFALLLIVLILGVVGVIFITK